MNKIFSINEPELINGSNMQKSDFGIVREVVSPGKIKIGSHVFKADSLLICLEDGDVTDKPSLYKVEIKDQLKLQRTKG